MKAETIRDFVNEKTEGIFSCQTARNIVWVGMAAAAVYFGFHSTILAIVKWAQA